MSKLVKIEVNVDTTNTAQLSALHTFLSVVGGSQGNDVTVKDAEHVDAAAEAPKKAASPKPAAKSTAKSDKAPEPAADAEAEAEAEEIAAPEDTALKIEDVRAELALKINANRDAIRDKLKEFGAASVTLLEAKHYPAMITFLKALK